MPMPCYMTITGTTQGQIQGSCNQQGREGTVLVLAVDHTIEIPKNPQTGLPSGKRVHNALFATKEIDKSSPKLFQALTSGEQLTSVVLDFYRIDASGKESKYYSITLNNAAIVSARTKVPDVLNPEFNHMGHMEEIGLTYESIVWTWVPDGIEAEDSWLAPKV